MRRARPAPWLLAWGVAVAGWGAAGDGEAATVVRGPYLQNTTDTSVVVRWRTDTATTSEVRYGPSPASQPFSVTDATLTTEHELEVGGLPAETEHFYTVGAIGSPLSPADAGHSFTTSPPPGANRPVRIWILGDSGTANLHAARVRDGYLTFAGHATPDVWLMLGDNAYGTGTDAQYQAAVFNMYPAFLRNTPLWPTRGNHDVLHTGSWNDYYELFTMPTGGEAGGLPSGSEAYYSFDFGDVHFVCLDSEGSARTVGSPMLTWLAADLAATTRRWILAYWHHPPYSKGSHDSDNPADSGGRMRDMRENVLPILEAGGADLVLTGHSHSYERSFLLDEHYGPSSTLHDSMKVDAGNGRESGDGAYQKSDQPHAGTVYAVAGSSGQISGGPLNHPVMVLSLNQLGSMVLDVSGSRLDAAFVDTTGAVRDEFTILKTSITGNAPPLPERVQLSPPVPNPGRASVRFVIEMPAAGEARLALFDATGRRVAELVGGALPAGRTTVIWSGSGAGGREVSSGQYYAVLDALGERRVRKVVWTR